MFKVLGTVLAYNEADCIGATVAAMSRACDKIIVFDHGSEDSTGAVAKAACNCVEVVHISRGACPSVDKSGVQSSLPWRMVATRILLDDSFDWVVWMDADELLRTPDGRIPEKRDIEAVGVDVIRPLIREFFPSVEYGFPPETDDPYAGFVYYRENPLGHAPRAWRRELTPAHVPPGRHIQDRATGAKVHPFYEYWPVGITVSNNEWLLDHYPFRSREQSERKVLRDRNWITPLGERKYQNYIKKGKVDVRRLKRKMKRCLQ